MVTSACLAAVFQQLHPCGNKHYFEHLLHYLTDPDTLESHSLFLLSHLLLQLISYQESKLSPSNLLKTQSTAHLKFWAFPLLSKLSCFTYQFTPPWKKCPIEYYLGSLRGVNTRHGDQPCSLCLTLAGLFYVCLVYFPWSFIWVLKYPECQAHTSCDRFYSCC